MFFYIIYACYLFASYICIKIKFCLKDRNIKRHYEDAEGNKISRKKMKKLRRINRRPEKQEQFKRNTEKCSACVNPLVISFLM